MEMFEHLTIDPVVSIDKPNELPLCRSKASRPRHRAAAILLMNNTHAARKVICELISDRSARIRRSVIHYDNFDTIHRLVRQALKALRQIGFDLEGRNDDGYIKKSTWRVEPECTINVPDKDIVRQAAKLGDGTIPCHMRWHFQGQRRDGHGLSDEIFGRFGIV